MSEIKKELDLMPAQDPLTIGEYTERVGKKDPQYLYLRELENKKEVEKTVGKEQLQPEKKKSEEKVKGYYKQSRIFSLKEDEAILFEYIGKFEGSWNATCVTDKAVHLKRRGHLVHIPHQSIDGIMYEVEYKGGIANQRVYIYRKNRRIQNIIIKTAADFRDLVREISIKRRPSNAEKKDYSDLERKLFSAVKNYVETAWVGRSNKNKRFCAIAKHGFQEQVTKFLNDSFNRKIKGQYHFLGASWENPILIYDNWIVQLKPKRDKKFDFKRRRNRKDYQITVINRSDIYLAYHKREFVPEYKTSTHYSSESKGYEYHSYTTRKEVNNCLKLYTCSGIYSFKQINYSWIYSLLDSFNPSTYPELPQSDLVPAQDPLTIGQYTERVGRKDPQYLRLRELEKKEDKESP